VVQLISGPRIDFHSGASSLPRQADPKLEQRILEAAGRLRARGGEKALTMRAVAKAAGTTTPTVYERYRDRDDILRALRLQTRKDLFATISGSRTLAQACHRYLEFALQYRHAYEVLYDRFAEPPSLHEPWPTFNLLRQHLTQQLGGNPRQHTRLMLSLWSLMHGTAMLLIRGGVVDPLRTQMFHACLDALEVMVEETARTKGKPRSGPKWPSTLILGEAAESKVVHGGNNGDAKSSSRRKQEPRAAAKPRRVRTVV
jgi:AcrR family transcriptional regulator